MDRHLCDECAGTRRCPTLLAHQKRGQTMDRLRETLNDAIGWWHERHLRRWAKHREQVGWTPPTRH